MNIVLLGIGFLTLILSAVYYTDSSGNMWIDATISVIIGLIGSMLIRYGLKNTKKGVKKNGKNRKKK